MASTNPLVSFGSSCMLFGIGYPHKKGVTLMNSIHENFQLLIGENDNDKSPEARALVERLYKSLQELRRISQSREEKGVRNHFAARG